MTKTTRRLNDASRFLNRELSWLEFNQRVLDEARDRSVPLLDRAKFLGITASNLDEFFMVRVGGLSMLADEGRASTDLSGRTPARQLSEISARVHAMSADQYRCFLEDLEPALAREGIRRRTMAGLGADALGYVGRAFEQEILPLLTPRVAAPDEDFPLLAGGTLHLALRLRAAAGAAGEDLGLLALPRSLPRFVSLPAVEGHEYLLVEDVVAAFLDRLYPGREAIECRPFRLTRNADMSVAEDLAYDLLSEMEEVLAARRRSECVRLETDAQMSPELRDRLAVALAVHRQSVYEVPGPLDLSAYVGFASLSGYDRLREPPWPPRPPPAVSESEPLFDTLRRRDVLIFTPYESFDPVVRFVEEAAADPDVLAIKQILYRTSRNSPVVAALARAAERGKQVTALVELKARFDEARNIEWARALERSGVQVIYGIRGLKTHAKICLVVRREAGGLRRYAHFGTGNYNELTARIYSDASLLTAREDFGADGSAFFNAITGYSQPLPYARIQAAPIGLRPLLMDLIAHEAQRRRQGQPARIMAKVNSLADAGLIDALYDASCAGVRIDLNVRGICCLRPGVRGLSENIRVVSVVDRFLEHARILYFHHGGDPRIFLSSADWMPRNLDKRIELITPVLDPDGRAALVRILETSLADNVKARELQPDGSWRRVERRPAEARCRSQEDFYHRARRAAREETKSRRSTFEPHRPPRAE
jgi:polyphosphate kinase